MVGSEQNFLLEPGGHREQGTDDGGTGMFTSQRVALNPDVQNRPE